MRPFVLPRCAIPSPRLDAEPIDGLLCLTAPILDALTDPPFFMPAEGEAIGNLFTIDVKLACGGGAEYAAWAFAGGKVYGFIFGPPLPNMPAGIPLGAPNRPPI